MRRTPLDPEQGADGSEKIMVGMSGGVDSAVSALLLKRAGMCVEGLFMKNWEEDDGTEFCTAQADLEEARRVCDLLDIPLHTANFAAEYWDLVFERFLAEQSAGRTPNPDVLCNRAIKFGIFADYASLIGAPRIATGHYVRIERGTSGCRLLKGRDPGKDQSYFLCATPLDRLQAALFPVGNLHKPEVRALAAAAGLPNHARKDSTGICFIGARRFCDFLQRHLAGRPGPIVDTNGVLLGQHCGLIYHTIGQRQGLAIGGRSDSGAAPWYVAAKDLEHNALVVVQGNDHPALFSRSLVAGPVNWLCRPVGRSFGCVAKTRYRQPDQEVHVRICAQEPEDRIRVAFKTPQRAVTPGQYLALYDGDVCLGGGSIQDVDSRPLRGARTVHMAA